MKTISITDLANVNGGETWAQGYATVYSPSGVASFPINLSRRPNTDDNAAINGGNDFLRIGNYKCGKSGGICGGQASDR